ncbi:MAG TPA: sigma-54 dependent transcriptional regulator [Candidatus Kapabacteria bacterium]|nr:sigma-54 dependent transcriptional regulator [Candidatus Kapabacteria bacterium]
MEILILDDNVEFCNSLQDIVKSFGYHSIAFNNTTNGLNYIKANAEIIGLVLLDIEFGSDDPLTGLDVLGILRHNYPFIPVVMITGRGTISIAVQATKLGAINFIEKSDLNSEKIHEVLESSIGLGIQEDDETIKKFLAENGIIVKSNAMLDIGRLIIRFGRTDLNVLLTGETGTGKSIIARALHNISRKHTGPFITVDIPNIPRDLFQSELFGHIKGAFSGAIETKRGLFHEANHGTLFLDEIGDLSLELQSNLFIPVDEKVIRKVGSVQTEPIDVRFISATDRDLVKMMEDGKFREQLFHRLRECEINIPSLRERREDVPDIVNYYVKLHNEQYNTDKYFTPSSLEYLALKEWKGNVRELINIVNIALQTIDEDRIEIPILDKIISSQNHSQMNNRNLPDSAQHRTLKEDLAAVDKVNIENALRENNGNVSKTAALLGVSRETLHIKIRKYGINTQKFRKSANQ